YNNAAWHAIFTQTIAPRDVENAIKATQMKQNNGNALHTLGCVYAEIGKTKEAREILVQAMEVEDLEEPRSEFWYAFGRIAEQYGLQETALADYARVTKPNEATKMPDSSYHLAAVRMQKMSGNGGQPTAMAAKTAK